MAALPSPPSEIEGHLNRKPHPPRTNLADSTAHPSPEAIQELANRSNPSTSTAHPSPCEDIRELVNESTADLPSPPSSDDTDTDTDIADLLDHHGKPPRAPRPPR